MSWAFCTSQDAINKAGRSANATIIASTNALAVWSDEAEHMLCDIVKADIITGAASLTNKGIKILGRFESAYVAQKIANYDLLSYGQMRNAETVLDVCETDIQVTTKILQDNDVLTMLGITRA